MYISEWCERRGITQYHLFKEFGFNKGSIHRWWQKNIRPDPHNLNRIASILGIPSKWLDYRPEDVAILELWWKLDALEREKLLETYGVVNLEAAEIRLPDDDAHLARMLVALSEQAKLIAEILAHRIDGKTPSLASLDARIINAAARSTGV